MLLEPDAKKAKPDQQITPQAGLTPSAAPTVTAAAPGFWRPGVPGFPQPSKIYLDEIVKDILCLHMTEIISLIPFYRSTTSWNADATSAIWSPTNAS